MSSLSDLKEEAKYRAEISASMEGYLAGVEKLNTLQKTIKQTEKFILELEKQKNGASAAQIVNLDKQLKYLRDQNVEYDRTVKMLKVAVKEANKYQMAAIAGLKSTANGLAKLPGLVQSSFGKLKGYGLFEMDKAVKMSALQMGLLGKEGSSYAESIRQTAASTNVIGVNIEALAKMQGQYTEDLGRSVMLGDKGLKSMAAMSVVTGLGAEGVGELAVNMEEVGISAERTGEFINQTMNDSHKMGINASKVVKNIAGNIKMLNKYHFKDGIRGLAKMSELTTKLGIKMDFAAGMSDKLWDIEGAVDMSAQLQVMGGAWAKMADPFHLMYMAREDMAGLTKEIAEASQESMHFAKDGSIEMSSMAMSKLKIIAQQTGLEYDDLVKSGKEMFKMNKVKQQIGFNFTEDQKEFIANTAQITENGKATITIDGNTKFVSQMTAGDQAWLKMQVSEKKSMADRAKASQNFDDQITNLINQVKTYMLPIIDGINQTLGPIVTKFMEDPNWQADLIKLGKDIGGFIVGLKPIFTTIGEMVMALGPKGTLAVLFGGKLLFDIGKWVLNGIALGTGFLGVTGGVGGLGAAVSPLVGALGTLAAVLGATWLGKKAGAASSKAAGNKDTSEGDTAANWGAAIGMGLGVALAPFTGGSSLLATGALAAAGAGIGSYAGKMIGDEMHSDDPRYQGQPIEDGYLKKPKYSKGRQIIQDGVATPITNQDREMFIGEPGGPLSKNGKGNQNANIPANVHHTFDTIEIKGSVMLDTPGNPGKGVDLLKDSHFIRQITNLIHVETKRSMNQKQTG